MDIKPGYTYRHFNTMAPDADPMNNQRVTVVSVGMHDGRVVMVMLKGHCHLYPVEHLTALRPSNAAIDQLIDDWDDGDPWGSGMIALGACCDVLQAAGEDDLIDPGAGYVPAMVPVSDLEELADETFAEEWQIDYETHCLAVELNAGRLAPEEIGRAARILSLYLNLVRDAGLDY